jgi:hypothetical protein
MTVTTSRRGILSGFGAFMAAPAIVRAGILMPVKRIIRPLPCLSPNIVYCIDTGTVGLEGRTAPPIMLAPGLLVMMKVSKDVIGNTTLKLNDVCAEVLSIRMSAGAIVPLIYDGSAFQSI